MSDDGLIPAAVVLAWVGIVSLLAMAIRHREPAPEPVTPPGRWEWGGAVVAALCGCGSLWSWYHVTGGSLNGDELISLPAWDLPAWESYLRDREFPGLLHRGVALGVGRTWGLQGLRMVHVGLWLIVALCVWWTARSTGARWSPLVAVGVFTAQAPVIVRFAELRAHATSLTSVSVAMAAVASGHRGVATVALALACMDNLAVAPVLGLWGLWLWGTGKKPLGRAAVTMVALLVPLALPALMARRLDQVGGDVIWEPFAWGVGAAVVLFAASDQRTRGLAVVALGVSCLTALLSVSGLSGDPSKARWLGEPWIVAVPVAVIFGVVRRWRAPEPMAEAVAMGSVIAVAGALDVWPGGAAWLALIPMVAVMWPELDASYADRGLSVGAGIAVIALIAVGVTQHRGATASRLRLDLNDDELWALVEGSGEPVLDTNNQALLPLMTRVAPLTRKGMLLDHNLENLDLPGGVLWQEADCQVSRPFWLIWRPDTIGLLQAPCEGCAAVKEWEQPRSTVLMTCRDPHP